MSKQPRRKKKLSTNKPLRAETTPPTENAPDSSSEDEGIIKAIPFYLMALGNFSVALWLILKATEGGLVSRGDLAFVTGLILCASAIPLVCSIITALLSWGIAKSKRYGTRLLLGLGVTLAPWVLFAYFFFDDIRRFLRR